MDDHGDQSNVEAPHREGDSGRSGGVDLHSQETHISGDVVGRDKTEINIKRATILQLDRRVFFALLGLVIVVGAALLIIPQLGKTPWATWETIADSKFGIAVAQFAVGGNLAEGPQGTEMSRLIYDRLHSDLIDARLDQRVSLTKVGLVHSADEAIRAGEQVHAKLVLWGWVPEYTQQAVAPSFTLVDDQAAANDSRLVNSLNLLINGPDTIRLEQLSGRATALSRFVLGLIYLREQDSPDYAEALKMFTLGIQELEQDLRRVNDSLGSAADVNARQALQEQQQATQKTLASFYTLQGITYAALNEPSRELASYRTALSYSNTYPRVYVALGNYYYSLGQYADAQSTYQRAIDLEDDYAAAYYGLGATDFELGEYDAAITALDNAIRLAHTAQDDRTKALAFLVKGHADLAVGKSADARQAFQAVVDSPAASDSAKQAARDQLAALDRPVPVSSPTPVSVIPTALPASSPTPTPTLKLSVTPSLIPALRSTSLPVATDEPAIVSFELLSPPLGVTRGNPITFKWQGPRRTGQTYQVTIRHTESGETQSSDLLTTDSWTVNLPSDKIGEWRWTVSVLSRGQTIATSNESFFWYDPVYKPKRNPATPNATLFPTPFPTPVVGTPPPRP